MHRGRKRKIVRQGFCLLTCLSVEVTALSSISIALNLSSSLKIFKINLAMQSDLGNPYHIPLMEKSLLNNISLCFFTGYFLVITFSLNSLAPNSAVVKFCPPVLNGSIEFLLLFFVQVCSRLVNKDS